MFGYFPVGIPCDLIRFGINGALTLHMLAAKQQRSSSRTTSRHGTTDLTASLMSSSSRRTSSKGCTELPGRANQASQTQQLVAKHRDTGDALRIRPSLPGRLETASFFLHSANFGLPWSSSTASSTSCSSEKTQRFPPLLTYSRGQSFSCSGATYLAAALSAIAKALNRPACPPWTADTTVALVTRRSRCPFWILPAQREHRAPEVRAQLPHRLALLRRRRGSRAPLRADE